jgi:hypothetical protein
MTYGNNAGAGGGGEADSSRFIDALAQTLIDPEPGGDSGFNIAPRQAGALGDNAQPGNSRALLIGAAVIAAIVLLSRKKRGMQ